MAMRETVNGTRSRTSGLLSRTCATTPSPGAATSRRWPVLIAAVTGPPGSLTSTTRRPAMCRLNVRLASSSI
jgi:hypothetical protein